MGVLKNLEKVGNSLFDLPNEESAPPLTPDEDASIREKELELELLRLRRHQAKPADEPKKQPEPEKKEAKKEEKKPKKRPDKIPSGAKERISYPVYLCKPDDDTSHTRLVHFFFDGEHYYFLEHNGRVYLKSEITNIGEPNDKLGVDGNLDKQSANIIFIDTDGNLEIGALEFTPSAAKIIEETDNLKMENRTYERIHRSNKAKFGIRPLDVILTIAVIGVVMMLLFWATFDGITKVISVENGGADMAWKTQHTPLIVNVSENQTLVWPNGTAVQITR